MKTWAKIGLWTTVITVVGVAAYKLTASAANIEAFTKQASFKFKVNKTSKSGSDILVKLNVEISNPTKTSISFEKPHLKLLYGGKVLTESTASSDVITIDPQSTTVIRNYTLKIPIDISTATILIDVAKKIGLSLQFTSINAFVSSLTDAILTKIMPQLTLSVLIYFAGKNMPVSFETKLSN